MHWQQLIGHTLGRTSVIRIRQLNRLGVVLPAGQSSSLRAAHGLEGGVVSFRGTTFDVDFGPGLGGNSGSEPTVHFDIRLEQRAPTTLFGRFSPPLITEVPPQGIPQTDFRTRRKSCDPAAWGTDQWRDAALTLLSLPISRAAQVRFGKRSSRPSLTSSSRRFGRRL